MLSRLDFENVLIFKRSFYFVFHLEMYLCWVQDFSVLILYFELHCFVQTLHVILIIAPLKEICFAKIFVVLEFDLSRSGFLFFFILLGICRNSCICGLMSLILENSQALSLQMLFLHQFSLLSVWDFTYIYVRPSQCTACLYFYILLIFDSPCFILNFFSDLFFNTFLHSSASSNLLLIPHTEFLFVGCGIFLYLEFPFGYFLWFLVIC